MRKILVSLVAIGAALFATSCVNELEEGIKGNAGQVTFTVDAPELATRAFGEAENATNLLWGVYEVNGAEFNYVENVSNTALGLVELVDGKASVQIDLLDGYKYRLLFWAVSDTYTDAFALNFEEKTLTMNAEVNGNNDAFDAFYCWTEEIEVNGAVTKSVTLTRPFAQLNIGSNDFAEAEKAGMVMANAKSTVTINGWLNTLDCVTGEATGSANITYKAAAIPTETFTVSGYNYLAMNYVLVGNAKTTIPAIGLSVSDGTKTITNNYNNVPVQRNYRTNVYGSLLTNGSKFDVDIDEGMNTPAYGEVWDGVRFATPSFDDTNKVMYIHDGYQLAWLAQFVNNGNVAPTVTRAESIPFDNTNAWTVEITNDIDLGGNAWTPIGTGSAVAFCSNFNGNGHTIKGLKVEGSLDNAGLFGAIGTSKAASIKNLTIDGAEIEGSHYAGAFAAWVQHPSDGQGNRITIENIHVKNSKVVSTPIEEGGVYDNGDKVGGVIGYAVRTVVDNCSAEKCEVTAYRDFAGVVGVANTNATVRNCSVKDVTLTINNEHNYKGYTSLAQYRVNSVTNVIDNTATAENNSGEATIVDPITEAFKADIADGNITLTEDVIFLSDEALEIEAGEEVTIDLNGKTLTLGSEALINNGELTISGGNIEAPNGNGVVTNAGGKLTIEANVTAYEATIRALGGEVTINGGEFKQTGTAVGTPSTYRYGVDVREGGKVVINGGEFTTGNGLLNVNSGCELVINGGKFTHNTEKSMTRHFAYVSGKLTINDGEFYGVANSAAGGCFFCGAAAGCDITINGGKFTSLWTSGSVNRIFEVYFGGKIFVSGGLFNSKGGIEAYVEANTDAATKDAYPFKANSKVVSDDAALADAVTAGNAIVVLEAGNYTMPSSNLQGKSLTIVGTKDVVIDATAIDANNQFVTGATIVFDGVTVNFGTTNYMGFANAASLTYKNCDINGLQFLYNPTSFENCKFNSTGEHCVWTYGSKQVSFTNCEFTYADRCVNVYLDNGTEDVAVDFTNCKFNTANAASVGAIEINASAFPQGAELNFTNCTAPANGYMVFISKWDNTVGATATVTVDGAAYTTPIQQ